MTAEQAVALDIGTSGLRGQLVNLENGQVIRTCIMNRNPIPGANIMDHLSFALECGGDKTRRLLVSTVHDIIERLKPEHLSRIAVCGNPIQLSLLEGKEFRDLAYAGESKLKEENIGPVDRPGHIVSGDILGFDSGVEIIIPPAVRHEIGADALAMMIESGFLEDDFCLVTDYGTNAEMALKVGDTVYTGSAAAGPALEGQQIGSGMLAGPGALSDLCRCPQGWRAKVLDSRMEVQDGPMINMRSGMIHKEGVVPKGITGTGVIALVHAGIMDGRMSPPKITGDSIDITRNIRFTNEDLAEAGKALGAIRAGHLTLMIEAGVSHKDIHTMYMAGASGTYVDPIKAMSVGMVPPSVINVVQVGNTSLQLAKDIAIKPDEIDSLNVLRKELLAKHIMFAKSSVFSDLYSYELAVWTEGMDTYRYSRKLAEYDQSGYLGTPLKPTIRKVSDLDIIDTGESLEMLDTKIEIRGTWNCSRCGICVRLCPEKALNMDNGRFIINTGMCLGTACMRCVENCPEGAFALWNTKNEFHISKRPNETVTAEPFPL